MDFKHCWNWIHSLKIWTLNKRLDKEDYIQRGGYTVKEALSCKNTILVFIVNLVELKSNSHIKYIYALSTCLLMVSHMALFSSSSLHLKVGMSLMIVGQGRFSRFSLNVTRNSSQSMSQKLSLGVRLDFSVDIFSCVMMG